MSVSLYIFEEIRGKFEKKIFLVKLIKDMRVDVKIL